jgi:hypothetical protein
VIILYIGSIYIYIQLNLHSKRIKVSQVTSLGRVENLSVDRLSQSAARRRSENTFIIIMHLHLSAQVFYFILLVMLANSRAANINPLKSKFITTTTPDPQFDQVYT